MGKFRESELSAVAAVLVAGAEGRRPASPAASPSTDSTTSNTSPSPSPSTISTTEPSLPLATRRAEAAVTVEEGVGSAGTVADFMKPIREDCLRGSTPLPAAFPFFFPPPVVVAAAVDGAPAVVEPSSIAGVEPSSAAAPLVLRFFG